MELTSIQLNEHTQWIKLNNIKPLIIFAKIILVNTLVFVVVAVLHTFAFHSFHDIYKHKYYKQSPKTNNNIWFKYHFVLLLLRVKYICACILQVIDFYNKNNNHNPKWLLSIDIGINVRITTTHSHRYERNHFRTREDSLSIKRNGDQRRRRKSSWTENWQLKPNQLLH